MTWRDAGIEGPVEGFVEAAMKQQKEIFRDTFVEAVGVHIEEASAGHAVATAEVGPHFLHPGGFAHGGAIAALGDSCAAWATFPALDEHETHTTIEFKANFLRSVQSGTLRAEASAIHKGRRTMVLDVRITDDRNRLVAAMIVTQAIVPLNEGRPEQGAEKP
jgi:uncharacterized protein (TIGR00369 family)